MAENDPDYFPVAVQRARDEAATRARIEEVERAEAAQGHRVLAARPAWHEAPFPLHQIRTTDGEPVDASDLIGRTGVAVHVTATPWRDDEPIAIAYYLDDPEALGYSLPTPPSWTSQSTPPQAGPMTEEQKQERRTLISRNKEWDAATTVRQEWLSGFLARKNPPKDATRALAALLTSASGLIAESMSRGNDTARSLLGVTITGYGGGALHAYAEQNPTRAVQVALAITLGGIEQTLTRDTWRNPSPTTARYLDTIAAWGHHLTLVEQIAALHETETATSNQEEADPEN